jgi:hypothetical protein
MWLSCPHESIINISVLFGSPLCSSTFKSYLCSSSGVRLEGHFYARVRLTPTAGVTWKCFKSQVDHGMG